MKLNTKSLQEVEIGMPLLAEGSYHVIIDSAEIKPNKAKDGNNLVVVAKINDPVVLTKEGKELTNKGRFKFTRRISLKPTADYDPDTMIKELAVAVNHDVTQDFNTEDLPGKKCMIAMVVRPAENGYPESNDVRRFTKRPDDDSFDDPAL